MPATELLPPGSIVAGLWRRAAAEYRWQQRLVLRSLSSAAAGGVPLRADRLLELPRSHAPNSDLRPGQAGQQRCTAALLATCPGLRARHRRAGGTSHAARLPCRWQRWPLRSLGASCRRSLLPGGLRPWLPPGHRLSVRASPSDRPCGRIWPCGPARGQAPQNRSHGRQRPKEKRSPWAAASARRQSIRLKHPEASSSGRRSHRRLKV